MHVTASHCEIITGAQADAAVDAEPFVSSWCAMQLQPPGLTLFQIGQLECTVVQAVHLRRQGWLGAGRAAPICVHVWGWQLRHWPSQAGAVTTLLLAMSDTCTYVEAAPTPVQSRCGLEVQC